MLLMYNRTYVAEIGTPVMYVCVDGSFCCGCKETLGDCGEGKETWCCSYEWQCSVGQGRVDLEKITELLDVALVGMKSNLPSFSKIQCLHQR